MKTFLFLSLIFSLNVFSFTPDEDETVADYRKAFVEARGKIWDMGFDDNIYFDCDLYNVRRGSAETAFMGFKITRDGLSYKMNMNLVTSSFQGVALRSNGVEVYGRRGRGDSADPLELIAIRVGKPISIENPMIDHYKPGNAPAERVIMSRPLYLEISQIQESNLGYVTKPTAMQALKDLRYRVKEYGVCYFSKFNSQLNNSGVGYPGHTRRAWDEVDSSPWGAHFVKEGPF